MTAQEISDLVASLVANVVPIGAIQAFAMQTPPDGWLPCQGQEFGVDRYPLLYAAIGNTFGGEVGRTFVLPDLQGRFVRGYDEDGNVDPQREFGSKQEDALQEHGHEFKISGEVSSSGEHCHRLYKTTYMVGSNFGEDDKPVFEVGQSDLTRTSTAYDGDHSHSLPEMSVNQCDTRSGGKVRTDVETRPKNIALLYCIKYM